MTQREVCVCKGERWVCVCVCGGGGGGDRGLPKNVPLILYRVTSVKQHICSSKQKKDHGSDERGCSLWVPFNFQLTTRVLTVSGSEKAAW